MVKVLYRFLRAVPVLGSMLVSLRLRVVNWILSIVSENMGARMDRISSEILRVDERLTQAMERTEFVRLEFFYEIQHRLRNSVNPTEDSFEPVIMNPEKLEKLKDLNSLVLNLGCGHKVNDVYLNIDRRLLPCLDVQADVLNLPFSFNEVDGIILSHVVEHFTLHHLREVLLPYWRDLLKPAGFLRIIVPNSVLMLEEFSRQKISFSQLSTVIMGQQEYGEDFHFSMFSSESICKLLQEVGFASVSVVEASRRNGLCVEMEILAFKPVTG